MRLEKTIKVIRKIEIWSLMFLGIGSTLMMFANAVCRYVFNFSFVWAEEMVRLFFVISMFIAITDSFFNSEHIGFNNIMDKSRITRFISSFVYDLVLATVGFVLGYYGYKYNTFTGKVPLAATGLPTSLFQIPGFVVGFVWFVLGMVRVVIDTITFFGSENKMEAI